MDAKGGGEQAEEEEKKVHCRLVPDSRTRMHPGGNGPFGNAVCGQVVAGKCILPYSCPLTQDYHVPSIQLTRNSSLGG